MGGTVSKFSGYPLTRWVDDRNMILEEDFYYLDKDGKKWLAPKKAYLNGATIPEILWSSIGSPYVGPYRRASVVHDYFVGEGRNPNVDYSERRKADKMFFRACRTDGCSWSFAATLYLGVSVGSWSSKEKIKHSVKSVDFKSVSINEDAIIEKKYNDIKKKTNNIINGEEDFDALEKLVNKEINHD